MSWSIQVIGKPENVVKAIEEHSAKLEGQCKIEFDDAKPSLAALVQQNFSESAEQPAVKLTASGSGYTRDGKQVQRSCSVQIEPCYTRIV